MVGQDLQAVPGNDRIMTLSNRHDLKRRVVQAKYMRRDASRDREYLVWPGKIQKLDVREEQDTYRRGWFILRTGRCC